MKIQNILFCLAISFLFLRCQQKSDNLQNKEKDLEKDYFPNGQLKTLTHVNNKERNGPTIFFDSNGFINAINIFRKDVVDGEVFDFYTDGVLKQKTIVRNGVMDGYSYSFYPNGSIASFRKWVKGKKEGFSEDYWENTMIKAVYFSRNDTLIFERLFDSLGYVIETKGVPPKERNPKIN